MKRIALYITLGIIVIIIGILAITIALPSIIAKSDADWEKRNNNYYGKVSYEFSGNVKSFVHIGGARSLITIELDNIQINTSEIQNSDDFVGLYDKDNNVIVMFNTFPDDFYNYKTGERWWIIVNSADRGKEVNIKSENLHVRVSSNERQIYYMQENNNKDTMSIHFPTVYTKHLIKKERDMGKVVRF